MELKELQDHIRTLVALPEMEASVISFYCQTSGGSPRDSHVLSQQIRTLSKGLVPQWQPLFDEAWAMIETWLASELKPETQGAAVFARAGQQPFFLPLQFRVPLPTWISADTVPNIYHLVELKDTYHRFVIMISTDEFSRIIEVNLGAVTQELWNTRPELRKRVGREWTKTHYQNHRRERGERFIKEKIRVLEKMMSQGDHTHLILAGSPQHTARVRKLLPKHLGEKLIDIVSISTNAKVSKVVTATIAAFVEMEERESQGVADVLQRAVHTGGLGLVGTAHCFEALQRGQADVLVAMKQYDPEPGWACESCSSTGVRLPVSRTCPDCGGRQLRDRNIREEMVRMAERTGCRVEIVNQNEFLKAAGEVGALLRYRVDHLTSEVALSGRVSGTAPRQ